jgi:iron(III) transport system permease protein
MALLLVVFGAWVFYPLALIVINGFNVAPIGEPYQFSLDNWRVAFSGPDILPALGNTFLVFGLHMAISFPIAVLIAWVLARTRMPFSQEIEFLFWISFMVPDLSTTLGWIMLLDPRQGLLNIALMKLPFVDAPPFNIYSVPGIVFAHLMGNSVSMKVMLLTPAFRNMDAALEEAAAVSGASKIRTMARVTLPVLVPAMSLVLLLNCIRIFQTFEIEQVLGTRVGFFVYSTLIFSLISEHSPPLYGQATALASVVLVFIAVIVPLQRWALSRRHYTTVTGNFRPGLVDLGGWQPVVFVAVLGFAVLLLLVPVLTLIGGSFMTRLGFFNASPPFTLDHWAVVLGDEEFLIAVRTTFMLSITTAVLSPVLFSLVAYILVRTHWPRRTELEAILWTSSAIPGILAGLGLLWMFLGTPFLVPLFGTIYALLLVMVLQGKLLSTQMSKAAIVQIGAELEEQARVSGASWIRTFFRIWLPLIMPTLVMIGTFNFIIAAGTTSAIILLASRDTFTLSLLLLAKMTEPQTLELEQAGIVSLVMIGMTAGVALLARWFGVRVGVVHQSHITSR